MHLFLTSNKKHSFLYITSFHWSRVWNVRLKTKVQCSGASQDSSWIFCVYILILIHPKLTDRQQWSRRTNRNFSFVLLRFVWSCMVLYGLAWYISLFSAQEDLLLIFACWIFVFNLVASLLLNELARDITVPNGDSWMQRFRMTPWLYY